MGRLFFERAGIGCFQRESGLHKRGQEGPEKKIVNCFTWGITQLTIRCVHVALCEYNGCHSSAVAAPLYAIYRQTRYTTTSVNTNIVGDLDVNLDLFQKETFPDTTLFIKTCGLRN